MANTYRLEDVSSEFNSFYNDLIRQKLKSLNQKKLFKRKSCPAVVKKIRPAFGGLFKSKKVPLEIFKEFPGIDHFPKLKDHRFQSFVDKKGFYLGLEKVSELKRIFNLGGVYVGTDKFAHFFELGGWYYDRYLKKFKRYKKRYNKNQADLKAKKDVVQWGFSLEGTITGKWSKMLLWRWKPIIKAFLPFPLPW